MSPLRRVSRFFISHWSLPLMALMTLLVSMACGRSASTPTPGPSSPVLVSPKGNSHLTRAQGQPSPSPGLATGTASPSGLVRQGYTADGHAFWGAVNAPVTLTDFSDFL